MPDNTSPHDPFADLYGRLPDPRSTPRGETPSTPRGHTPSTPHANLTSTPLDDETASSAGRRGATPAGGTDPRPVTPGAAVPSSRRAAREARRAQTGETPTSSDAASVPQPAPAAPAASTGHAAGPERGTPDRPAPAAAESAPRPAVDRSAAAQAQPMASGPAAVPARDREPVLAGAAAAASTAPSERPTPAGSLEDLFSNEAIVTDARTSARPPKRRRRTGMWVALAIVAVVVGGVAAGGAALWKTYGTRVQAFLGGGEAGDYDAGMATGEARITIVSGDTGQSVSPKLFEAGVTKTSDALYKYMVKNAVAFTFQPGVYKLQQQMTSAAVIEALRDPASRLDNSVQLREGLTVAQSIQEISDQLKMPLADLQAATKDPSVYGVSAPSLEGWLFPATYDFDEGVTAKDVVQRMVTRTMQSLDAAGVPASDRQRILIIASIIQREARNTADFYKVSRVIENRLQPDNQETFGKLEMDSTVQYGAGEMDSGSVSTSAEARNSDNGWNTYIHPGLPVGPISNPGDLAIEAAMKPADGPWLYFVTVNLDTGETVFSTTYAEHEAAVKQWQDWCSAHPNSGC